MFIHIWKIMRITIIFLKSLVMVNLLKSKSKLFTILWAWLWLWISQLFNVHLICHWAKDCLKKCFWKMTSAMSKSCVMAKLFLATKSSWAIRAKFSRACWAMAAVAWLKHPLEKSKSKTSLPMWWNRSYTSSTLMIMRIWKVSFFK